MRTLLTAFLESTEDKPGLVGSAGRFHVTPDHRLFVVCYASGTEPGGRRVAENRLLEIQPDGSAGVPIRLPLARPFTSCFTTTVRGGSPPSRTLEMLGPRAGATVSRTLTRGDRHTPMSWIGGELLKILRPLEPLWRRHPNRASVCCGADGRNRAP